MSLKHSVQIFSKNKSYLYNNILKNIYDKQGNILYSNINKSKSENIYVANLLLNLPNNIKLFNILDENEINKINIKKRFKIEQFTNNKIMDNFVNVKNNTDDMILSISSADTPGIIHNVVNDLTKLDMNIKDINSYITPAPMTGINLFNLKVRFASNNNNLVDIINSYEYEIKLLKKIEK
tara:strand:+ start:2270 stop:2809 length:540 start_codon:yes stop_codon:yes gene_type:complete